MQFRWWNSFNLLAVVLLAIGIMGLIAGKRMVFDPGRTPTGYEWAIYLVAGGLMLVNGFLPPANPAVDPDEDAGGKVSRPSSSDRRKREQAVDEDAG
jgi:hypothetical protein